MKTTNLYDAENRNGRGPSPAGEPGLEQVHDVLVAAARSGRHRGTPPPVDRARLHAVVEQVRDHLTVALRGGQVKRGAAIVVADVRIHAGGDQGANLVKITLTGGPAQPDLVVERRLVLAQPGVTLVRTLVVDQAVIGVEVVPRDQLAAELDTAYRVTQGVEPRRPDANAHDLWDDEHQRAGHTTLGRQSDREGELPRVVVHATGGHQRQTPLDRASRKHPTAAQRGGATVGQ